MPSSTSHALQSTYPPKLAACYIGTDQFVWGLDRLLDGLAAVRAD